MLLAATPAADTLPEALSVSVPHMIYDFLILFAIALGISIARSRSRTRNDHENDEAKQVIELKKMAIQMRGQSSQRR